MKKAIAFIVAAALVAAGLVLIATTFFLIGFDFTKLDTATYTETTFDFADGFATIDQISVETANVRFVPTTDGSYKVVCKNRENIIYDATVTDGALTISYTDQRTLLDYVGIFHAEESVTIYMPAGSYGSLTLVGNTGDVEIPCDFSFERLSVSVSTGDIRASASVQGELKLTTSTGDVDVNGVTVGNLSAKTTTGDVDVSRITCTGDITIHVSSGDVELTDVTCQMLTTSGGTGEIDLEDVVADEQIEIRRTTGDVDLTRVDAATLDIETSTGDVEGTLRTAKTFDADASTGDVRVPQSDVGGLCKIRTTTGDIYIRIDG